MARANSLSMAIGASGEPVETTAAELAPLRLLYARNMRSPLGLGQHVIGDYVRLQCFAVPAEAAAEEPIFRLAEQNRAALESESSVGYLFAC